MREALPAFGFLAALVVVPFIFSTSIAWSVLHFTDTGLLIGSGKVITLTSDTADTAATLINDQETEDGVEKTVVQCPYFTSAGFIEKLVEHKKYGYRGQRDCPWRINISA